MENIVNEPALEYDYISPEEYLDIERTALEKHEYFNGKVLSMKNAFTIKHHEIFSNTLCEIGQKLKGTDFEIFGSNFRLYVPKIEFYAYADMTIVSGKVLVKDDGESDNLLNPSVIIELVSKTTRNYDMGEKFTLYRNIDTLKEYILIDTEKVYVQIHVRNADNSWQLTDYKSIDNSFTIDTVQISLSLKDVYADVSFE